MHRLRTPQHYFVHCRSNIGAILIVRHFHDPLVTLLLPAEQIAYVHIQFYTTSKLSQAFIFRNETAIGPSYGKVRIPDHCRSDWL
jgi:hypothetical protein